MDRVQGVSEISAEMNMGRDFARGLALLWKEWSSILVQGEKINVLTRRTISSLVHEGQPFMREGNSWLPHIPPRRKCAERRIVSSLLTPQNTLMGSTKIHMKAAFFSRKLALSLLFVLDNNKFHEHGVWSAW